MSRIVIGVTGIALSMVASMASAQLTASYSGAGDVSVPTTSRGVLRNIQP